MFLCLPASEIVQEKELAEKYPSPLLGLFSQSFLTGLHLCLQLTLTKLWLFSSPWARALGVHWPRAVSLGSTVLSLGTAGVGSRQRWLLWECSWSLEEHGWLRIPAQEELQTYQKVGRLQGKTKLQTTHRSMKGTKSSLLANNSP